MKHVFPIMADGEDQEEDEDDEDEVPASKVPTTTNNKINCTTEKNIYLQVLFSHTSFPTSTQPKSSIRLP